MTYFAYLDEFGHIGPYISREDTKHNDSPVFGLAGFVLPAEQVRGFGTWFFQRKCELLSFEIKRAIEKHQNNMTESQKKEFTAQWEKKGSSLYTVKNISKYPELRQFTNRLLNKINKLGGFTFYFGINKNESMDDHNPNKLQQAILREAIKRIGQFCTNDCEQSENFILILDDHDQRQALITSASQSMYGSEQQRYCLIEPPFHLDSHRYQTLQAADWIAALVGRLGAFWADQTAYSDNQVFCQYFKHRLNRVQRRSGVRVPRVPSEAPADR